MPIYEVELVSEPSGPPPDIIPRNNLPTPTSQPSYEPLSSFHSGTNNQIEYFETGNYSENVSVKPKAAKHFSKTKCLVIIALLLLISVFFNVYLFFSSHSSDSSVKTKKSDRKSFNRHFFNDTEICSPGYTWFPQTNYCYKAYELPDSYDNAETTCQSEDAHLTSIHFLTEAVFINGLYHVTHRKRRLVATKYIFWIGLNQTNGTWEWLDGSRLDYDILSAEYKNSEEYSSAQGAAASHTGILWFRTNLTVGGFVCKKPTIDGTEERRIVNDLELDNDKCPFRYYWMESVGSCYRISVDPAKYDEATQICQSDNGNLLSVHSNLENILINGLIMMIMEEKGLTDSKPPFWIGLRTEKRKFVWTDGSEVDFFDSSRVPKLTSMNETFAWTYWDSWSSFARTSRNFICKIEL